MINPTIALGVVTRTQMTMLLVRLRKVAEAKCLSNEERKKLSAAVEQLRQAVVDSSELGPGPIVVGEGVPPVNKEEILSELREIAKQLNEVKADDWMPEAARKSLSGSLGTIEGVLGEMS
jgi:hypothetical protein